MRIWARSFFSLFFHHFARIFTECDWLALAKGGVFIWCNHGHVEQTADFGFFVLCGKINSVLPVINISILWCYLFSWDIPSLISIVYYFSRKKWMSVATNYDARSKCENTRYHEPRIHWCTKICEPWMWCTNKKLSSRAELIKVRMKSVLCLKFAFTNMLPYYIFSNVLLAVSLTLVRECRYSVVQDSTNRPRII